jgi:hypothetical protein
VGPRAGLDRCGKFRPHRDSIPGPSSPVAQSLYRLSYRAHTTRFTIKKFVHVAHIGFMCRVWISQQRATCNLYDIE